MNIEVARALAKILALLNRFRIVGDQRYHRLIDELTIKVLEKELEDK